MFKIFLLVIVRGYISRCDWVILPQIHIDLPFPDLKLLSQIPYESKNKMEEISILNHTLRKHITRVWDKSSISHELR